MVQDDTLFWSYSMHKTLSSIQYVHMKHVVEILSILSIINYTAGVYQAL